MRAPMLFAVVLAPVLVGACASLYGVTDVPTPDDAGEDGTGDGGTLRDGTANRGDGPTGPSPDGGGKDHHAPDASGDGTVTDAPRGDAPTTGGPDGGPDGPPSASTLVVTPTTLAFGTAGKVACGSTPATKTFKVTNGGAASLAWWTAFGLGAASPYAQSQAACSVTAPCTIAAGVTVTVTVTAPPVPADAGITTYDDVLTIFSRPAGDAGGDPESESVTLHEASYGAILAYSPTSAAFGAQPSNGTTSTPIQILNSGNAPVTGATLGLTGSDEFALSSGAAFDIPLTGTTFTVSFTPGGDTNAVLGRVALAVPPESTCAALPAPLPLSGQGTSALVSVTSSLNFNSGTNGNGGVGVSCGTTGPTLPAVVSNTGSASATITALTLGLGGGSPFTVSTAALPITVTAGSSAMIPVVPNGVAATSEPAATLDDTLHVTVNGTTYDVALHETTAGAVLSLATTSLAFSATEKSKKTAYGQVITNRGNLAAAVTFSASNAAFTFDGNIVAAASANTPANAYFTPTTAAAYTATGAMVIAAGTPRCAGSSGTTALSLSGTGTNGNTYTVAPTSLAFGAYACGTTAPAAQTVTITNGPLNLATAPWTATLTGTNAALFRLSAASGTAGNFGGTSTFTVAPIALTSSSGLTEDEVLYGVSAILTVVVGTGAAAETFTLPVTEMPTGNCGE